VHLKRGDKNAAHFAYPAGHTNTCCGSLGCAESVEHYNAKWKVSEDYKSLQFWQNCPVGHRLSMSNFMEPAWLATVEKLIAGTKYRADVLFENKSTGETVALEIYHSHAVHCAKYEACEGLGVRVIEIDATEVNSGNRILDNRIRSTSGEFFCRKCIENEKKRKWQLVEDAEEERRIAVEYERKRKIIAAKLADQMKIRTELDESERQRKALKQEEEDRNLEERVKIYTEQAAQRLNEERKREGERLEAKRREGICERQEEEARRILIAQDVKDRHPKWFRRT
jgi:hypothetical protein